MPGAELEDGGLLEAEIAAEGEAGDGDRMVRVVAALDGAEVRYLGLAGRTGVNHGAVVRIEIRMGRDPGEVGRPGGAGVEVVEPEPGADRERAPPRAVLDEHRPGDRALDADVREHMARQLMGVIGDRVTGELAPDRQAVGRAKLPLGRETAGGPGLLVHPEQAVRAHLAEPRHPVGVVAGLVDERVLVAVLEVVRAPRLPAMLCRKLRISPSSTD
ncbi:MAG TPA: hypothetical protein VNK43_02970 [Gemmatimonadales bacterium]|nr:hypothetical protein [Gemmatimonadales bacterium]